MTPNFTPRYTDYLSLENIPKEYFAVVAVEAAKELFWKTIHVSREGLLLYTNNSNPFWNAEIQIIIEDDVAVIRSVSVVSGLGGQSKNKKNVETLIAVITELLTIMPEEELAQKAEQLQQHFAPENNTVIESISPSALDSKYFLSIFQPTGGYFVTPLLLLANITVFILVAIVTGDILWPSAETLSGWGANDVALTLGNEGWRLITSCFVNFGILHLLVNLYALSYLGLLIEPLMGKTRFAAAYLLAGIVGGLASIWWHSDPVVVAGASGAVFGIYGAFITIITTGLIAPHKRLMLLTSTIVFAGVNIALGLMADSVDNAAHIGGLLGGMIVGYTCLPRTEAAKPQAWLTGLLAPIVLITFALAANKFVNPLIEVYQNIQGVPPGSRRSTANRTNVERYQEEFAKLDRLHTDVARPMLLSDSASRDERMFVLKNAMIALRKCIAQVHKLDTIDTGEDLHSYHENAIVYYQSILNAYELMYKAADEDTEQYNAQIELYYQQINQAIERLAQTPPPGGPGGN